jgi:hypothetical protein
MTPASEANPKIKPYEKMSRRPRFPGNNHFFAAVQLIPIYNKVKEGQTCVFQRR